MSDVNDFDERTKSFSRSNGTASTSKFRLASKKQRFEIHEIDVLKTAITSSVSGETSGHGIVVGGTGFGSSSGSVKTTFKIRIFTDIGNFTYDSSDPVQFMEGERVLILSKPKDKFTGERKILSFFSISSGTKMVVPPSSFFLVGILYFFGIIISIPLMIVIVGFFLAPVCLVGCVLSFYNSSAFEHAASVFKELINTNDVAIRKKKIDAFNELAQV